MHVHCTVSTVHMIEVQSLIDWEANVLMAVASVHFCLFHYCLVDNQCIKWRCICVFLYLHLMQSKVRFNVTAWWPSGAPQPLWPRKSSPLIYLQIQIKYIIYRNNWKYKSNCLFASHCLFLFLKVEERNTFPGGLCSKGMGRMSAPLDVTTEGKAREMGPLVLVG